MKTSPMKVLFRRQWKLILAAVVGGLALGIFLGISSPSMYATSALIHVSFSSSNPLEEGPDYESKFILFGTIEKLTASEEGVRAIALKNGLDASKIDNVVKSIKVEQAETSELIKISVVAPNPKQAINIANDLAAFARSMANNRWLDQLKGIISYTQKDLEAAQAKVDDATQAYETARQKYTDLNVQAVQAVKDDYDRQINEANNRLINAQAALTKASTSIPKDNATVNLATDQVDKATRDLANIQQAALAPISFDRRVQLDDEINRASGRSDALDRLNTAKSKVNEIQNKLTTATALLDQPDLHAASVSVVESARYTEKQGDLTVFFALGGLILGLAFGVALAIAIGGSNLEQYEQDEIAKIYQHPVLISVPLYKDLAQNKRKKKTAKPKAAKGATQTQDGSTVAATDSEAGAFAHLSRNFGELAGVLTERHAGQLSITPGQTTQLAAAYSGGAGKSNSALTATREASALRFLVVTGNPGTGNTTLVSNVGKNLAQMGYRTLLVDGNRRNPQLPATFGLGEAEQEGRLDKSKGQDKGKGQEKDTPPTEKKLGQIYKTDYPELDIMPYSALPVHPGSGVVRPAELTALLNSLENQYQVILCDTPALNVAADAIGLAQHFPEILFIVDGRQPKVGQDLEKLTSLTIGSAKIEGLVINQA